MVWEKKVYVSMDGRAVFKSIITMSKWANECAKHDGTESEGHAVDFSQHSIPEMILWNA